MNLKKDLINYCFIFVLLIAYYYIRMSFSYHTKDLVAFLNVGTGDAILIQSNGRSILVDGGPNSYSINGLYRYTFYKKPQAFIATHFHSDHISGLAKAVSSVPSSKLFFSFSDKTTYESNLLLNESTNIEKIYADDELVVGDFNIKVIWPNENCTSSNLNYCSLVLLVSHRSGESLLLASDSEINAQEGYYRQLGEFGYLKVPHQGAGDSLYKPLISKSSPDTAVISVGENNYGHPHQYVVDYYKETGIEVLRTDEEGDIVLVFD